MRTRYLTFCLVMVILFSSTHGRQTRAVAAELPPSLVRVGLPVGQSSIRLFGNVSQADDGTLNLPGGEPWGWIAVGEEEQPLPELEGLRSLSICGWARPVTLAAGQGGNRLAFNLNYNRAGFDLVQLEDGRLRLAVNQWPDRIENDSSPNRLHRGQWVFFAVAYDGTRNEDNVRWYFGESRNPARLDRTNSYAAGAIAPGSGPLTIGNYNRTIQRHGKDRQFRGQLHGIRIFGSQNGAEGALDLAAIRRLQADPTALPDFSKPIPAKVTAGPSDEAIPGIDFPAPTPGTRPRIIATTDGEIDDRCSMIRFLLHANEWDIEGIIHSSSKFHWKGNGKDVARHSWADEVWLDEHIDLYEQVYPKLSQHAEGYPTADALRRLVYTGNVSNVGDMSEDTPGSDRIVEVLLDHEPGPVYLQAWGGTNTIARALWKIQHEHPDQMEKVSKKAVIYIILDQDKTFREYIAPNWPDLPVLGSFRQFAAMAYSWAKIIPPPERSYFEASWMKEHILNGHGPLCAIYEAKDGAFRSEGDSPSFMHQIDVGLRSLEHPSWGGWGGRFVQEQPGSNVWRGARDGGNVDKPIWRWAIAFQNDWAARADWCVRDRGEANHPPRPVVAGPLDRTVEPGQQISLSADGSSDPDGDDLQYRWWQYTDVDTATTAIEIRNATSATNASFEVPDEPGKTVHVILEVSDNGTPPLTRYRRIVCTIE